MQRNTKSLREDIDRILAGMESTGHNNDETDEEREPDTAIPGAHAQEQPDITVNIHDFPDARVYDFPNGYIVIPKQEPFDQETDVIDTTLAEPAVTQDQAAQGREDRGSWLAWMPVSLVLLLVLFSFLHALLFPPIAQITLILKSVQVGTTATLQSGRNLATLTLSQ